MKRLTGLLMLVGLMALAGPARAQQQAPPTCEQTLAAFRVLAEQLALSRQQGEVAAAERIQKLQADLAKAMNEVEALKAAAAKK